MEQTPSLGQRPRILLSGGNAPFRLAPFEIITLLVILAVAAFAGYTAYARQTGINKTAPTPPTYIPTFRTTLTSSVSTTGTVQASQQVNLTFDVGLGSAKIKEFLVGLGDQVKAGQALARLDDTDLVQSVRSAQAALDSAQARLNATVNPSADSIASGQQSVTSSTAQVATAQKNLDDTLAKPLPTDVLTAQQAVGAAQSSLQTAQNAVTNAQTTFNTAQSDLSSAQLSYGNAIITLQNSLIALGSTAPQCAAPFQPGLPGQISFCSTVSSGGGGTATSGQSASSAISTYNSAINAYNSALTNVTAKQTALTTAQTNLTNGSLQLAIQNAQTGLANAQQKLSDTLAGPKPNEIEAAQNSLASAQAAQTSAQVKYNTLFNPPPDTVLPMRASVEQASANLTTAQKNLAAATITAPFDGQISQLTGSVGTQVSSSTTVFILLNPKLVRIDANVDQADINNLKQGQQATVTFDALAGRSYNATVAAIGLTPTIQQGVVTYVVSFAMDTSALPANTPIPAPGMTASLTIQTSRTDNALVVPARAIRRVGRGATTVTVLNKDGSTEVKTVVTGASNGTLTQITSGLNDGDIVLVSTPTTTTTTAPTNNPFGGGGGGGPVQIGR